MFRGPKMASPVLVLIVLDTQIKRFKRGNTKSDL